MQGEKMKVRAHPCHYLRPWLQRHWVVGGRGLRGRLAECELLMLWWPVLTATREDSCEDGELEEDTKTSRVTAAPHTDFHSGMQGVLYPAMATVAHAVVPFANQRQANQKATKHVMSFMQHTNNPPPCGTSSTGQLSAS